MILVYWLPTFIESFLDRKGETKRGKIKDFWWALVGSAIITGLAWLWFGENPFTSVLMILMFRLTTFDYITHALLKRYSEGHKDINIWKFTGTTTHFWDQWIAKINWVGRMVIRVVVFGLAVLYFFWPI